MSPGELAIFAAAFERILAERAEELPEIGRAGGPALAADAAMDASIATDRALEWAVAKERLRELLR